MINKKTVIFTTAMAAGVSLCIAGIIVQPLTPVLMPLGGALIAGCLGMYQGSCTSKNQVQTDKPKPELDKKDSRKIFFFVGNNMNINFYFDAIKDKHKKTQSKDVKKPKKKLK